jgi:hypothetical protein
MEYCFRCGRPLDEGDDALCSACEFWVGGFRGALPPLKGRAGQLIWRALEHLQPLSGSDVPALKAQLREAARLLMAAVAALEEN